MSTRAKRAWSGSCTTLQMITCVASSPSCIPARSRPVALRVAFNAAPLLRPLTGIGNHIVPCSARRLAATGGVDLWSFHGYRWRHEAPTPPAGGTAGDIVLSAPGMPVKPVAVPYRREAGEIVLRLLMRRRARVLRLGSGAGRISTVHVSLGDRWGTAIPRRSIARRGIRRDNLRRRPSSRAGTARSRSAARSPRRPADRSSR